MRKSAKPKKAPRQNRSKMTVDSILQAATYILTKYDWSDFNTNKIAEKAGVNIASVYQYFPNKESILAELHRRHLNKMKEKAATVGIGELIKKDLHSILRILIEETIREHKIEPKIHRLFSTKIPQSAADPHVNWDKKAEKFLEKLLLPKAKKLKNKKFAAFFFRTGAHSIIHDAIERHPEFLDDPEFSEELLRLFEGYFNSN